MRAFCGKSMTFGTDVRHTKPSKFSYATISQKLRGVEPSLSTLYIGLLVRRFQKSYCRIHHAIVSAIFGGHLSKMADISQKIGLSQKLRGAEFQF